MISFSNIFSTAKELLLNPKSFWKLQSEKEEHKNNLFLTYLLPLLLVVAIAVFIGEFIKRNDFFVEYPALKAARIILLFVLTYYISVFFTNELIKTFGGTKNKDISKTLVVYSLTPFLLVSIITGLFQFLYVIDILGIYGFYIFWMGAKELLNFPEEKQNSYILITIVVIFFVFSFLSIFLSKLLSAYY